MLVPLDPPAVERLADVSAPALVLLPALDHPDLHAVARLLGERLPRATVVEVPGAGHMLHIERPGWFTRTAVEFLENSRRPTTMGPPTRSGEALKEEPP